MLNQRAQSKNSATANLNFCSLVQPWQENACSIFSSHSRYASGLLLPLNGGTVSLIPSTLLCLGPPSSFPLLSWHVTSYRHQDLQHHNSINFLFLQSCRRALHYFFSSSFVIVQSQHQVTTFELHPDEEGHHHLLRPYFEKQIEFIKVNIYDPHLGDTVSFHKDHFIQGWFMTPFINVTQWTLIVSPFH